ncbi:NAD(P)/FAD-dependent oxidoreductase [Motiliproteus sediminis]|uniref:NAD(P)/FAD-dependent oxidoreductase n=1 Tax=Motiliproteus sediminis TaxID=1468178 RepID=UPI001AF00482|nr:NAD(P)/FAD-dependent oxidoreductase [Motiliproteus sediminis]
MHTTEVLIIGAGAAGLFCAIQAGYRGRKVRVIDHARKPGKKILMAGGGRCNFTNREVLPKHFRCSNPHFVISALKRFSSQDFIDLVERHAIDYHERDWGQLFCDHSSKDLLDALLTECEWAGVELQMNTEIHAVETLPEGGYRVQASGGAINCESLVIATGGLSFPNAGATDLGLRIARQFGLPCIRTHAALVPFTLQPRELEQLKPLAGIAVPARIRCGGAQFRENLLFTHRGISGPVVLQASNYWQPGQPIEIDLLPQLDLADWLKQQRQQKPRSALRTLLAQLLPKRLLQALESLGQLQALDETAAQLSDRRIEALQQALGQWRLVPSGTEGYRTAEVTLGGVDTHAISSKTFEAHSAPGLYFIGEVLDVTGWLGGYNLQWAWASGYCAGQYV